MNAITTITAVFSRWMTTVADTVCSITDRFAPHADVLLTENDDESFTLHVQGGRSELPDHRVRVVDGALAEALPTPWANALRGSASRIQLQLRPTRFLIRPLELPKRATEFLGGIIRSQIDRLTPWSAEAAVYGWTHPDEATQERVRLNIVVTARSVIAPLVRMAEGLGAGSVVVSTAVLDADAKPVVVNVFEQRKAGTIQARRIQLIVTAVFLATGIAAAASVAASVVIGGMFDNEQQELAGQIAHRRAALRAGNNAGGSAQALLEQRKRETPASVIVLEALSKLLPDHTYVTELRVEGDKVQVIGITQDAPSLIGLIEQSPHFTRATFFAPTTRAANDPGERFHIEARIKPYFQLGL